VKLRYRAVLLRELLSVLPKRAASEWCELAHANNPRGTVVVVCGFGATERSVSAIRKRLLKDQYDVIVLAMGWSDFSDGVLGLAHMAERLNVVVQSLSRRDRPLFVVAHSAGGLVARYFLQKLGGHRYSAGLITLGTPHRGTWIAALGFVTHLLLKAKVLWELLPISRFIRELNAAELDTSVRILSIRSLEDQLCPKYSTDLPESWKRDNHIRVHDLPGLSHMDFLTSKDCYVAIANFLEELTSQKLAVNSLTKGV
jgi:triacylglycerol lipase